MPLVTRFAALAAMIALTSCAAGEPPVPDEIAAPAPAAAPVTETAEVAPVAPSFSADWPQPYNVRAAGSFEQKGIDTLEARMAQFVSDGDVMGIATLLVQDGEVISHMQAGIRRAEDGAPIEEDTLYRIYSMTKPITGVAMMILYEEGAFSLDDPITKFIPEFEDLQVYSPDGLPTPVSRPATMRELMSHTAGFAYGLSDITPPDAKLQELGVLAQPDLDSFIETVAGVPLLMEPGTNWYYSLSVDIQGAIIERITGEPFGDFLQTRIFDPLGMDDTGFYVPEAEYDRFGDVFMRDAYTGDLVPFTESWVTFREDTVAFQSGGGGLVSTLDDYARFCQMLLDEGSFGGVQILKPETVKLMTTNVLTKDQSIFSDGGQGEVPTGVGFGLNVGVITGPAATDRYGLGTHFWGGAAGTWYWIDPENDLFFIGMIQRFATDGDQSQFREISGELVHEALNDGH